MKKSIAVTIAALFVFCTGNYFPGFVYAQQRVASPQQDDQTVPNDQKEATVESLIDEFKQALQARATASGETQQAEALTRTKEATKRLVDALTSAQERGDYQRVLDLVKAMREVGIKITQHGNSFLIRFPKEAWQSHLKPSLPKDGFIAQSDFCYTGWQVISDFWIGGPGCSTHIVTLYCSISNTVMSCVSLCGSPEDCGTETPLPIITISGDAISQNDPFVERLITELERAVEARAIAQGEVQQAEALARSKTAAKNLVGALTLAAQQGKYRQVHSLVAAMRSVGVRVLQQGGVLFVSFPRSVWEDRKQVPLPKDGFVTQDFCYTGWEAIQDFWIVQSGCQFHVVTYYCLASGALMTCSQISCGGSTGLEECSDELIN